jgi:phage shock protein A
MQIVQRSSTTGISTDSSTSATPLDQAGLAGAAQETAPASQPGQPTQAAPLRRGLSNWDQPLQNDISSAQQAVDFLEQSAAQLRALKTDLATKLAARQLRDGQVEQRVRQFSDTWKNRREASGGTLDANLKFSAGAPASQRFTVRGMTLQNLRNGARETLAVSVGGGAQGLRSVHLSPGLSDHEIVGRFDQALAPAGVRVEMGQNGELVFSTDENNWPAVRDAIAVQGSGIRFPTGQLNRLKAEAEAPAVAPENWDTTDIESMRNTLQQVMQALSHVEAALSKVRQELNAATQRAESSMPEIETAGVEDLATRFASIAKEPGYQSLLALTSALVGINRERVVSLLSLR